MLGEAELLHLETPLEPSERVTAQARREGGGPAACAEDLEQVVADRLERVVIGTFLLTADLREELQSCQSLVSEEPVPEVEATKYDYECRVEHDDEGHEATVLSVDRVVPDRHRTGEHVNHADIEVE